MLKNPRQEGGWVVEAAEGGVSAATEKVLSERTETEDSVEPLLYILLLSQAGERTA